MFCFTKLIKKRGGIWLKLLTSQLLSTLKYAFDKIVNSNGLCTTGTATETQVEVELRTFARQFNNAVR